MTEHADDDIDDAYESGSYQVGSLGDQVFYVVKRDTDKTPSLMLGFDANGVLTVVYDADNTWQPYTPDVWQQIIASIDDVTDFEY